MKKILSLVTCSCLIASSMMANDLKNAFENGDFSGNITFGAEILDNDQGSDAGFIGSIGLNYKTASFNGFKLNFGLISGNNYSQITDEDGDFAWWKPSGSDDSVNALLSTANISYGSKYVDFTLGRQRIELEWMKDFHEAFLANIKPTENLDIVIGYSDRKARANPDEALIPWGDSKNCIEGIYFTDAKYNPIDSLNLNAYYYSADKHADWYGAKTAFDTDSFGATAHYAISNDDSANQLDDGSILHLEARGKFGEFGVKAAYIKTDDDVGVTDIMTVSGDNVKTFDDGLHIYDADADTYLIGTSYSMNKNLKFKAVYGQVEYSSSNYEEELVDLMAFYSPTEDIRLKAKLILVDTDELSGEDDYNRIEFAVSYLF